MPRFRFLSAPRSRSLLNVYQLVRNKKETLRSLPREGLHPPDILKTPGESPLLVVPEPVFRRSRRHKPASDRIDGLVCTGEFNYANHMAQCGNQAARWKNVRPEQRRREIDSAR